MKTAHRWRWHAVVLAVAGLLVPVSVSRGQVEAPSLPGAAKRTDSGVDDLRPLWQCLAGKTIPSRVRLAVNATIAGNPQPLECSFTRRGEDAFELTVRHPEYAFTLDRDRDETRLRLPKHHVSFVGKGAVDSRDHLAPRGGLRRLLGQDSKLSLIIPLIVETDPSLLTTVAKGWTSIEYLADERTWRLGDKYQVHCVTPASLWTIKGPDIDGTLKLDIGESALAPEDSPSKANTEDSVNSVAAKTVEIPRIELERQLARGFRRACEVLAPGPGLTSPAHDHRQVDHGELRWQDGQRIAILSGTPEEIGKAHGQILAKEAARCVDSVLYAFGTVHTISTGRWFREDLEAAYRRLAPHIPAAHTAELHALADSIGLDRSMAEALGVFPELFHCSGFAVFGKATVDGKLYHGRVLDYMTTIGLQDAATTFIVSVDGKIPFANVGYAGFVGSVSGMNARGISLGEMGGRGEGKWDGVPMTTLMRRALEECSTLDEVMDLWRRSPRTCEYYYVFAEGKTRRAVGVAATPEEITFIHPGQSDPRLGEGIPDAVVLSAGDRLRLLRERVQRKYGAIDAEIGQWLMSRPVAMGSNLHNVLFVPEDGLLYVANAAHGKPAAECPYVRIDLNALLKGDGTPTPDATAATLPFDLGPREREGRDSLKIGEVSSEDTRAFLEPLVWAPVRFGVSLRPPRNTGGENPDILVRFPSPVRSGDPANDLVALEWYLAKNSAGQPRVAPAVVVVHESGKNMPVGRLFARGLRQLGFHAFLIHLPNYGERRGGPPPENLEAVVTRMRQGIADIRRARDAVADLPYVDSRYVALQGTSLGGFAAAVAGALDDGFQGVYLMLAGGNLESIIQHGAKDTARLRRDVEKSGISPQTLHDLTWMIEPNRIAHRLPSGRTWLFSGLWDDVVPYANGLSLAQAAGLDAEHHVKMMADHYSGILLLPMVFKRIHDSLTDISMSPPAEFAKLPAATTQVVHVRQFREGGTTAVASAWEREDGQWRPRVTGIPANLGRHGVAPLGEKREGDGRTPSGVFPLGVAFGSAATCATGLAYRAMDDQDLWVDDVESPDYNRLVRAPTSARSFERMQLSSGEYELGAVIEYNTDPVVPGAGSAIFMHVQGGPNVATSGCVSLAREDLCELLAWLDREKSPQIVIEAGSP